MSSALVRLEEDRRFAVLSDVTRYIYIYLTYLSVNMAPSERLPAPTVIKTTHDKDGKSIVNKSVPEHPNEQVVTNGDAVFYLGYATEQFPVDMNNDTDLKAYEKLESSPPGLTISGGTVLRYVDLKPGCTSAMHRTISLDYGIVIAGQLELVLDSGETRILGPGDICVQRGTMHAWKNPSDTTWARVVFVLVPSKPLEVNGQKLGEDYGGNMAGVRASS